jgi:hypothetical protein
MDRRVIESHVLKGQITLDFRFCTSLPATGKMRG